MSNVDKYCRNLYINGLKGKVLALLLGRIACTGFINQRVW